MRKNRIFGRILAALVLIGSGAGLAACGGSTAPQLSGDVQVIATGLSAVATDLAAIPGIGIPAGTMTQVQSQIALIQSQASAIGSTLAPGQPALADFVGAVNVLATLVQPYFSEAPAVAATVVAAASLAQIALNAAGGQSPVAYATVPGGAAPSFFASPSAVMSAPAAKAVLTQSK